MVKKVADLHGTGSVSRNESTHDTEFAKGGSTKMFSEQQASPQTVRPDRARTEQTGKGAEFAKGGSGKMHGFAGSQAAQAGITSAR
jgi:hypothetical protein